MNEANNIPLDFFWLNFQKKFSILFKDLKCGNVDIKVSVAVLLGKTGYKKNQNQQNTVKVGKP